MKRFLLYMLCVFLLSSTLSLSAQPLENDGNKNSDEDEFTLSLETVSAFSALMAGMVYLYKKLYAAPKNFGDDDRDNESPKSPGKTVLRKCDCGNNHTRRKGIASLPSFEGMRVVSSEIFVFPSKTYCDCKGLHKKVEEAFKTKGQYFRYPQILLNISLRAKKRINSGNVLILGPGALDSSSDDSNIVVPAIHEVSAFLNEGDVITVVDRNVQLLSSIQSSLYSPVDASRNIPSHTLGIGRFLGSILSKIPKKITHSIQGVHGDLRYMNLPDGAFNIVIGMESLRYALQDLRNSGISKETIAYYKQSIFDGLLRSLSLDGTLYLDLPTANQLLAAFKATQIDESSPNSRLFLRGDDKTLSYHAELLKSTTHGEFEDAVVFERRQ